MTDFKDDFENAFEPMLDYMGDTVVYTPVGGTAVTIQAIFNEQVGAIDDRQRAIITVDASVVTNPRRGDRFTLSSRTWKTVDVREDEAGTVEMRCDLAQEDV